MPCDTQGFPRSYFSLFGGKDVGQRAVVSCDIRARRKKAENKNMKKTKKSCAVAVTGCLREP